MAKKSRPRKPRATDPLVLEQRRQERLQLSLTLSKIPNLNDQRNRARALAVIELAYDIRVSTRGKKAIYAKKLMDVCGNTSRYPGTYFKTLFRVESNYSQLAHDGYAAPYTYRPVPHRLERLAAALGYTNGLVKAAQRRGWSFKTSPPQRADLPRTNDRVYPWWVLMQAEVRRELFLEERRHGFDYDIKVAKPTTTLQKWSRLMQLHLPEKFALRECRLPAWHLLVKDRTAFRQALAAEVNISLSQAKEVTQVVLNGGWASPDPRNGIYSRIGRVATLRLMESGTYQQLRADFQVFWRYLRRLNELAELNLPAKVSAGTATSMFYNQIEDEIMTAVEFFLGEMEVWFMHDGFMTTERIFPVELAEYIKANLGYEIELEETELCKSYTLPRLKPAACRASCKLPYYDLHSSEMNLNQLELSS